MKRLEVFSSSELGVNLFLICLNQDDQDVVHSYPLLFVQL